VIRKTTEVLGLAVTLLFAAWLIDTWTHGALAKWAREWWAEMTVAATPIDVAALSESVVAEAIGITRAAAKGGNSRG